MFGKIGRTALKRAGSNAVPSIVSKDLSIAGNLSTDGEIHIDGQIDGDVTCRDLTIGAGAKVKGEIVADSVRVYGEVQGRIRANSVEVSSAARIEGDILHRVLTIQTGAFVDGLCRNVENPREAKILQIAASSNLSTPSPEAAEIITLGGKSFL